MKLKPLSLFALTLFLGTGTVTADMLDTIRPYPMREVIIMASRTGNSLKNMPQKIEIISKKDIQSVPNENLAEVVKRLTNLDVIQYPGASATIGMRGFSPSGQSRSYTLLLINGKPAGTINLASIIPSNIERIEVIKGPYAALYGSDAMGGVINLITETLSDDFQGKVSLEGGNFKYYRLDAALSGTLLPHLRGGVSVSTMKQGEDYLIGRSNLLKLSDVEKYILDNQSYGDTMPNSTYDLNTLNTRLEWDISKRWRANAEVSYTFGNNIEMPDNYWGSYGSSKKELQRFNTYGTLERKGKLGVSSLSPYFTRENEPNYSNNTTAGFVNFESEITEYGFQLQQQLAFGAFKAVAGIDAGVYDYHSERFESTGTPASPYKPDNSSSNAALFTQISYHNNQLDMNAGARYDRFWYHMEANEALHSVASDNAYNTFNPSIGAQYRVLDNLKVHTSLGTAFSVPDAFKTAGSYDVSVYYAEWDYLWTQSYVGNPDLKPERSVTTDVGMSYFTPNHAFYADVTYFYTHHDKKIVEVMLTSGAKSYVNANESRMDGLEVSAEFDVGALFERNFPLKLYTNWTYLFHADYSKTTSSSLGADSTFLKDMLYVRKLNGTVGLSYQPQSGFSARLNARYNGSRFEDDCFDLQRPGITGTDYTTEGGYLTSEKVLKYPDFLMVDLNVQYAFKNKLSLGLTISNLFDDNYTEKDGYNMPGRQYKLIVGYNF